MTELDYTINPQNLRGIELLIDKNINIEKLADNLLDLGDVFSVKMDIEEQDEELILLQKLKNLKFFNGSRVVSHKVKKTQKGKYKKKEISNPEKKLLKKIDEKKLNDLDENYKLKKEKEFYGLICDVIKEFNQEEFKDIKLNYNDFFKRVEMDLNDSTKINKYDFIKNSLYILANIGINNFCFTKGLSILKDIDSSLYNIFYLMNQNLNKKIYPFIEKIINLEEYVSKIEKSTKCDRKEILNHTNDIMMKAEQLYKENEELLKKIEQDKKNWAKERRTLEEEIKSISNENNELTSKIIKNSKLGADSIIKNDSNIYSEKTTKGKGPKFNNKNQISKKEYNFNINDINNDTEEYLEKNSVKILPLKQIKEIIKEIFISKENYNKKRIEFKLNFETMEQHLIRFFQNKFGIKSMVTEWVCIVKSTINKYHKNDSLCYLFKLIIDNKIDEDFKQIYDELNNTLKNYLKQEVKDSNKFKSEKFQKNLLENKIKGKITKIEINNIIRKLFSNEENNYLKNLLNLNNFNELEFVNFEKEIMRFYIDKHNANLEKLSRVFKSFDSNNDGILDQEELIEFLDYIDPLKEMNLNKELIIRKCDPYNHNIIIFSQLINVFSETKINIQNEIINVIQFSNI